MSKPIVSICIPTYNRAMCLQECLSQTLAFQGAGIEVIVSDNASEDDTRKIVSSFNDPRLKYFHNEENIGFVMNFFRALSHAEGEWVLFLSDEDYAVNLGELLDTLSNIEDGVVCVMGGEKGQKGNHKMGDEAAVGVGFTGLYVSGVILRRATAEKYCDAFQWDSSERGLFPHQTLMLSMVTNDGDLFLLDFHVFWPGCTRGPNFMDKPNGYGNKHPVMCFQHFKIYSEIAVSNLKNNSLMIEKVSELWLYHAKRSVRWAKKRRFGVISTIEQFYDQSIVFMLGGIKFDDSETQDLLMKEIDRKYHQLCIENRFKINDIMRLFRVVEKKGRNFVGRVLRGLGVLRYLKKIAR